MECSQVGERTWIDSGQIQKWEEESGSGEQRIWVSFSLGLPEITQGLGFSWGPMEAVEVAPRTFKGKTYIFEIGIPAFMSQIGTSLCEDCTELATVKLAVKSIPARAFKNCWKLVKVVSQVALTEIGEEAFMKASALRKFACPANKPWNIGKKAFMYCTSLKSIGLRDTVLSLEHVNEIGAGAFCFCISVEHVSLGIKPIKYVGCAGFAYCTRLEQCDLPERGMFHLDEGAFFKCKALKIINLSALRRKSNTIGKSAFHACECLPAPFKEKLTDIWPQALEIPTPTLEIPTLEEVRAELGY